MSNTLQHFNNSEFGEIRTVIIDGEIYFVGKDIATSLGYANPRDALSKHVDYEDKRSSQIATPSGVQTMTVINESGLYSLVLSSNLPNAKKFKRWVTSDVLPSIRKRGVYATDDFIEQAISNPKWAIDVLTAYQEEKDKNVILTQQVNELTPKATYYDIAMNNDKLLTTTELAENYGLSAQALNQMLEELGVQYKRKNSKIWHLKQPYTKYGWGVSTREIITLPNGKTIFSAQLKWTLRGERGIKELLNQNGMLMTLEKESILN